MKPMVPVRFYLGDFMRDFGDAAGGILIGIGIKSPENPYGWLIAGSALIGISVFLRFYIKKA